MMELSAGLASIQPIEEFTDAYSHICKSGRSPTVVVVHVTTCEPGCGCASRRRFERRFDKISERRAQIRHLREPRNAPRSRNSTKR